MVCLRQAAHPAGLLSVAMLRPVEGCQVEGRQGDQGVVDQGGQDGQGDQDSPVVAVLRGDQVAEIRAVAYLAVVASPAAVPSSDARLGQAVAILEVAVPDAAGTIPEVEDLPGNQAEDPSQGANPAAVLQGNPVVAVLRGSPVEAVLQDTQVAVLPDRLPYRADQVVLQVQADRRAFCSQHSLRGSSTSLTFRRTTLWLDRRPLCHETPSGRKKHHCVGCFGDEFP